MPFYRNLEHSKILVTHTSLKLVVVVVILIITDTIIQPLLVAGALHGLSYLILRKLYGLSITSIYRCSVVVLKYVHKFFDGPPFRRWKLIHLSLSVGSAKLLLNP